MSSLINSASVYIAGDTPKKRVSTMRKTIKKKYSDSVVPDMNRIDNDAPSTIEELQNYSNERSDRVNELLNEMSSLGNDEENTMGDFSPIEPPNVQIKKDMEPLEFSSDYNPTISTYLEATNARKNKKKEETNLYGANDSSHAKLSNYLQSYDPPKQQPYYKKMGIGSTDDVGSDKLMERINYMIHLLEAQQHEKTDTITEEFILYLFLGAFVIFVVDSFARTGSYKR
jgi:DNA polymerase I-like protein with 3'-5' exonuclease and polymerase domains